MKRFVRNPRVGTANQHFLVNNQIPHGGGGGGGGGGIVSRHIPHITEINSHQMPSGEWALKNNIKWLADYIKRARMA